MTSSEPGHKPTVKVIRDVDCLLWAIGRNPNTEELCLDRVVRQKRIPFPLSIAILGLQSFLVPCGTIKSLVHPCQSQFLHPGTFTLL